jgi:hypothetical protein
MADLYSDDTFVMKKKAIYKDILTCGLYSTDNVYKVYEWREETVSKARRIIRLELFSPLSIRTFCCS